MAAVSVGRTTSCVEDRRGRGDLLYGMTMSTEEQPPADDLARDALSLRDEPRIEHLVWRRNRIENILRLRPLTRLIRTVGYSIRERRFVAAPARAIDANGHPMNWRDGLVATVAFNRPDITRWQIHLAHRNLAEAKAFAVFDNSSDAQKRAEIRVVCAAAGVPYVALPVNTFRNSRSHGAALNWIFRNYVRRGEPAFFGFLDHDIFPIEPMSIRAKLEGRGIYGLPRGDTPTKGGWFLWAGYCFFAGKYARLELDFCPTERYAMDTGGGNWPLIYRDIPASDVQVAEISWARAGAGDSMFEDFFQIIDGRLHVVNASHWKETRSDRGPELLRILRQASGPDVPDMPLERI
jgi:hypothetical protein